MTAEEAIYEVEGAVESAGFDYFKAAELNCYIPGGDDELQKKRPRVELIAVLGAWTGKRVQLVSGEGTTLDNARESAWECALQVDIVTDAEIRIHRAYRAKVRNLISQFCPSINGVSLLKHQIMFPVATIGSSPIYKDDQGFYRTTINHGFKISVQTDAFSALADA